MEEQRIESINPNTGYGAVALVTIAVTGLCAYLAWVHNLLYEIDILRFFWAYWVSIASTFIAVAGVLFLLLITHIQLLAVWTLRRIRKHGIESLDTHTINPKHIQNKQINED